MPPFATLPADQLDALVQFLVESSQGGRTVGDGARARSTRPRRRGRRGQARDTSSRRRLDPRGVDDLPLLGHRARDRARLPLVGGLGAALQVAGDHGRRDADGGADRLPRRDRRVRLLGPVRDRLADRAGGPLDARRAQLARLLPPEHRPQGDRDPVPRHDDLLLRRRRPDGDDVPRRARAARHAVRGQPDLQRPGLGARGADDLPVRHPGVRRARELRDPADDRRAGHGVPAPERALVLAAADRRLHDAAQLPRPGRRVRDRLDGLRAVIQRPAARDRCSSTWASSGPVRRRS